MARKFNDSQRRAAQIKLLGALKLQPLSHEPPSASGNVEDEDDLMQCDSQVPSSSTLDRTFNSRTSRVSQQGDVHIAIDKPVPLRCDAKSAEVAFSQACGSSRYKDTVDKTLALENVQGVWKITRETVTKGRSF